MLNIENINFKNKRALVRVDFNVPLDENNRHYAEIKRQVDAGELTIEDAD